LIWVRLKKGKKNSLRGKCSAFWPKGKNDIIFQEKGGECAIVKTEKAQHCKKGKMADQGVGRALTLGLLSEGGRKKKRGSLWGKEDAGWFRSRKKMRAGKTRG